MWSGPVPRSICGARTTSAPKCGGCEADLEETRIFAGFAGRCDQARGAAGGGNGTRDELSGNYFFPPLPLLGGVIGAPSPVVG